MIKLVEKSTLFAATKANANNLITFDVRIKVIVFSKYFGAVSLWVTFKYSFICEQISSNLVLRVALLVRNKYFAEVELNIKCIFYFYPSPIFY